MKTKVHKLVTFTSDYEIVSYNGKLLHIYAVPKGQSLHLSKKRD